MLDLLILHQRREQRLMLALALPPLLVILPPVVLPVGWLAWEWFIRTAHAGEINADPGARNI